MTLDPGFVNTASCQSAITYIDGDKGILRYRGYPIEQLAEQSTFLETAYLLIYGELPSRDRARAASRTGSAGTRCCTRTSRRSSTASRATRTRCRCCRPPSSALSTFYQDSLDPADPDEVEISTIRLLAKLPTIAAYAYKKSIGQPFLYPDNSLSYVENFLRHDLRRPGASSTRSTRWSPRRWTRCSCCTPTTSRTARPRRSGWSARATPTCSPASAPASTRCSARCTAAPTRRSSRCSRTSPPRAATSTDFVRRVKAKEDGVKLMGFGHRVYKSYDPRAAIVKKATHEILQGLGKPDPMLELAMQLEEVALIRRLLHRAQALPQRRLLHGLLYKAMGFPTKMFTVLFATRPAAGLDRPVARDDARPADQDRPPAAGLHRPGRAAVQPRWPAAEGRGRRRGR